MPFLFCPIGPTKSKKTTPKNAGNTTSNKNPNVEQDPNATSSLMRIVTKEHHAQADDELSVSPGDLVLYEYTYEKWTYVASLRTSKRGFVPDNILTDLRRTSPRKKKLPRFESANHHEHHNHLEPHDDHSKDLSSRSGDNTRLVPHHHHHHHRHHSIQDDPPVCSVLPSLHGSSGKQSFPRFADMRILDTPPHDHHVKSHNSRFDHLGPDITRFHEKDLGTYLVVYNFTSAAENDLSVTAGEYVTLLNRDDKDWFWVRKDDRVEGFVPARFMCRIEDARSIITKGNSMGTMDLSRDCHTYINHPADKESLATDQHSSSALIAP